MNFFSEAMSEKQWYKVRKFNSLPKYIEKMVLNINAPKKSLKVFCVVDRRKSITLRLFRLDFSKIVKASV